ncbi:hypothetical protein DCAR_0934849 [Daucus carota subsp. sativus]|uniref:peroxidase n=1 Tax=Daucus carota subsp. sativus TaxID=79200 RepID=A0AAF0XXX6_DAUCS|nr:hypothetical protein DCAR_0934849 [Daucus carota subsp. sativus]
MRFPFIFLFVVSCLSSVIHGSSHPKTPPPGLAQTKGQPGLASPKAPPGLAKPKGAPPGLAEAKGAASGQAKAKSSTPGLAEAKGAAPGQAEAKGAAPGLTKTKGAAPGLTEAKGAAPGLKEAKGAAAGLAKAKGAAPGLAEAKGAAPGLAEAKGAAAGLAKATGAAPGLAEAKGAAAGLAKATGAAPGLAEAKGAAPGLAEAKAAEPEVAPPKPLPPGLSEDYYAKTCPSFDKILLETITPKQQSNPTTAAATLRVYFHDCFVEGCDGSVLLNPGADGPTERENPLNLDLPGDAFDVIVRVKTALELSCPGVVSCSDILAAATRHLIKQTGGPLYKLMLGKKDSRVSIAKNVDHNLVDEKVDFDTMYAPFSKKGFTIRDMVVLLGGGHTLGFAHCNRFASRIYKFSPTQEIDPSLNPGFAQRLRQLCANYTQNEGMSAFLDPVSPGKFDNNFFNNVMRGLDLLPSDHILLTDPRSKPMVEEYALDQNKFFADFSKSMEKLNVLDVKTGNAGEVRTNCFAVNGKA